MDTDQASDRRQRVAVVGGGISGLAAAYRLCQAAPQLDVALLEAGPRLGGVLYSQRRGAYLVEHSADMLATRDPWAVDLCRELGVELVPTIAEHRRAFVVRGGRLHAIPDGFALMSPTRMLPLLTTRLLSVRGKLRLLAERFVKPRTDESDESLASFARRRFGQEAFERLVQPLISGIYTADPDKLSMAATMPQFLDMERRWGSVTRAALRGAARRPAETAASGARYGMFTAPREGMSSLVEAIAGRLPKRCAQLNAPVASLRQDQLFRWHLELEAAADRPPPAPHTFDAVVLATPAYQSARLLRSQHGPLATHLERIAYADVAIVVLAYRHEQLQRPPQGTGFVVPLVERRPILAASFASNKFPGRAPDGHLLVRVFIGGACRPELVELPESRLAQLARDQLQELLGIRGGPQVEQVVRWPRAMPQYHVGHLELIERIERRRAQLPRLALAGNAYRGVGIPQSIHSGQQAADAILQQLR